MQLFTKEQERAIIKAIEEAERGTSAEIKIHIDKHCKTTPLDEAVKWFYRLGMENTELSNGVLIYIAYKDRKVAIIGDKGINELVEDDFWDSTYKVMKDEFVEGRMCEGLCKAILNISIELKRYFPYSSDDINELSDEISYGK